MSSQNPSELCVFMTAGTATGKISLVQITSPFSGLNGFLYGTFESIIVGICFGERFHIFLVILAANSHLCHTDFAPVDYLAIGHMLEVIVIENDTRITFAETDRSIYLY